MVGQKAKGVAKTAYLPTDSEDFNKEWLNDSSLVAFSNIAESNLSNSIHIQIESESILFSDFVEYIHQHHLKSINSTKWASLLDKVYLFNLMDKINPKEGWYINEGSFDGTDVLINKFFSYKSSNENAEILKILLLITYQKLLSDDKDENLKLVHQFIESLNSETIRLQALIHACYNGYLEGMLSLNTLKPTALKTLSDEKIAEQLNYLGVEVSQNEKYPKVDWLSESLYRVGAQLGNGHAQANLFFTCKENYKSLFWAYQALQSDIPMSRKDAVRRNVGSLAEQGYELSPWQFEEYRRVEMGEGWGATMVLDQNKDSQILLLHKSHQEKLRKVRANKVAEEKRIQEEIDARRAELARLQAIYDKEQEEERLAQDAFDEMWED